MKNEISKEWIERDNVLKRELTFKSYTKTMAFANAVAWLSNQQNHHPDMLISYNKCVVSMTTHDAGNTVTDKDYKLALAIDALI